MAHRLFSLLSGEGGRRRRPVHAMLLHASGGVQPWGQLTMWQTRTLALADVWVSRGAGAGFFLPWSFQDGRHARDSQRWLPLLSCSGCLGAAAAARGMRQMGGSASFSGGVRQFPWGGAARRGNACCMFGERPDGVGPAPPPPADRLSAGRGCVLLLRETVPGRLLGSRPSGCWRRLRPGRPPACDISMPPGCSSGRGLRVLTFLRLRCSSRGLALMMLLLARLLLITASSAAQHSCVPQD